MNALSLHKTPQNMAVLMHVTVPEKVRTRAVWRLVGLPKSTTCADMLTAALFEACELMMYSEIPVKVAQSAVISMGAFRSELTFPAGQLAPVTAYKLTAAQEEIAQCLNQISGQAYAESQDHWAPTDTVPTTNASFLLLFLAMCAAQQMSLPDHKFDALLRSVYAITRANFRPQTRGDS